MKTFCVLSKLRINLDLQYLNLKISPALGGGSLVGLIKESGHYIIQRNN